MRSCALVYGIAEGALPRGPSTKEIQIDRAEYGRPIGPMPGAPSDCALSDCTKLCSQYWIFDATLFHVLMGILDDLEADIFALTVTVQPEKQEMAKAGLYVPTQTRGPKTPRSRRRVSVLAHVVLCLFASFWASESHVSACFDFGCSGFFGCAHFSTISSPFLMSPLAMRLALKVWHLLQYETYHPLLAP